MDRRNPQANTGYVNWPTHLINTREGGMFVYVVVPMTKPFQMCCGVPSAYLLMAESLIEEDPNAGSFTDSAGWPLQDKWFPALRSKDGQNNIFSDDDFIISRYLSCPLLAAVCLGSSGGSFWDGDKDYHDGQYWYCKMDDLTEKGKEIVRVLEELYGVTPSLLTFLDT